VTTLLAFLFVLGVLIFVHELGHFLVARWYGVRVLTFSLGFGPKLLTLRRGDTEYCVSAVPLGGYVKLAGETVQDDRQGAPDEFLSKSKWVRFQVYLAGPVMNIALAIVVLTFVLARGADVPLYHTEPPVIGNVATGSAAEQAGLRPGDRILSIDGRPMPTWDSLDMAVLPKANQQLTIVVDRQGERVDIPIVPDPEGRYEIGTIGIGPPLRPQIGQVSPDSPAERAGLQRGDVILAVNGERGLEREDIVTVWQQNSHRPVQLELERQTGEIATVSVTPEGPEGAGLVGVILYPYEVRHVDPTLAQAFVLSLEENWANTRLIGQTLAGLFTREVPMNQLMGPIAIADLSGRSAGLGWTALFSFMAMISLNLGLINLLPIPVMDGGQIAILALEGAARRDMSMRVKERILLAGAALIVLLMVTVIYNDIARLLR
jgi:regulator of sigma E protease